jgi:hypothetical protein
MLWFKDAPGHDEGCREGDAELFHKPFDAKAAPERTMEDAHNVEECSGRSKSGAARSANGGSLNILRHCRGLASLERSPPPATGSIAKPKRPRRIEQLTILLHSLTIEF